MLRNIKIRTKFTLAILAISLAAVAAIGFFTYDYNVTANREKFVTSLNAIADSRAAYFSAFFERAEAGLRIIQESSELTPQTESTDVMALYTQVSNDGGMSPLMPEPSEEGLGDFLQRQKAAFGFDELYLTTSSGSILASTDARLSSGNFAPPDGALLLRGKQEIYFGTVVRDSSNRLVTYAAAPITASQNGDLIIAKIDLTRPYRILSDYRGLGRTGDVVLARQDPITRDIMLASTPRTDPKGALQIVNEKTEAAGVILRAISSGTANATARDFKGTPSLQAARLITPVNWVVVTTMNLNEAEGDAGQLIRTLVYAGLCVVAFAVLLSMVIGRSMMQPLSSMQRKLALVADGILPEREERHSSDEFGQMATKVDDLVQTLKNNAEFAQRIGEGKYDTEFKPVTDNDVLGMALINMRKNLIENERRDKERNWIVRGVAEISEILRLHDTLDPLGEDVIKFILEKINAIQGAFYVVNEEDDPVTIDLRASFAYGRKKYLQKRFKFAEGLVGQAVAEKDTILRTEIPKEYMTITSGILGDQRPTCLLIVPLITNEEVYGVLEFAGFRKFDSSQVNFVKELSLILARTIFNIKVNERTRRLLEESQAMSNELKEKQEVLRQNAEEMQATQEELQRTNDRLEEQIEEVNRTQKRMQLLLENASEVITIYEEDETIRYISPSVELILGYGQKELIGKSDVDLVHPDYQDVFRGLFRKMAENPDEKVTVQYEYRTKEGNYIWIESTGTNCMSNPAIHGFILNSRDITERRRAEQEQRMRSKMQALSENSPDLIARLEQDAISYINPVIETYSGSGPEAFINRKINETDLDKSVLEKWLEIVEQVNATNNKVATEMEFPSRIGQRVMQVNAIPEYDESEKLESVLVVSHDITERKMIELEIQNKNKKITESINYAKRIQNAILPSTRVINRALPDSFILYKPRDVVSGDFPWYVQIKDDIFIAAVDCTGHGVPGALLSLIGYFLLNDIVRSRKVTEPGKILDLLDEGVTTTLRQDEDATTKDGMDIALCKINLASRQVEYAGAHRPLYVARGGEIEEIKGNKFPIGGGIFKNQTNFTNHKIKLNKGDSIYFSSDGYPDQFGGPEGRKFGPRRVRETIMQVHDKPMKEVMEIFDREWEAWRGDQKQTDDVLLIGIKF
ncbi:MAG: PAS domain S-box protein [Bacteroidota bacterium]|jgi:PAS domain S-box-containing protein|nr:MAG: pas/pac sensor protein [Bacteroidota bacterium]